MNIVASVGYYDGAANGVGRYAFARGGFYFGQFLNGRVDGYGVYFDGNDYHIGIFENGVFIYTNHADGLVAMGEIRNSMLNGRVTICYITGETVEADCADNKPIETYHTWDKFGREVW